MFISLRIPFLQKILEAFKGKVFQGSIRRLSWKTWYSALLPRSVCTDSPTTSEWCKRQNEFLDQTAEYDGISVKSLRKGILVRERTGLVSWLRRWVCTQEISLCNRLINWCWVSHFSQDFGKPLIPHLETETIKAGNIIAFCPWPVSNFPSAFGLPLSQQSISASRASPPFCLALLMRRLLASGRQRLRQPRKLNER